MILPASLNNALSNSQESVLTPLDLENIKNALLIGGFALESSVQSIITALPTNPASREDVYGSQVV